MFKSVQKTILACIMCLFAILVMTPGIAHAQPYFYGYPNPVCQEPANATSDLDCNDVCRSPEVLSCRDIQGTCFVCSDVPPM